MKNIDNIKNQTIGIEIEMTGITREKAAQIIADFFHTEKNYIGGAYYAYEVSMPDGRKWSIMRDSSIYPQRKERGNIVYAKDEYLNFPSINSGIIP